MASVTAYSFISTMPKDSVGLKFTPLVRADASVTPFTLYKGIGASPGGDGTTFFSHLAIATHTAASPVKQFHPGVQLGGVYLSSIGASKLSAASSGKFSLVRATRFGELVVNQIAKSPSLLTTSRNTLASQTLYGLWVSGNDVNTGDTVVVKDGVNTMFSHVFTATSENRFYDLPGGVKAATSLVVDINQTGGGGASVTLLLLEV
jgi:hypothetical protein